MHRSHLVVGFAASAAICAVVFAGCGGDTTTPTPAPVVDAGTTVKDSSISDALVVTDSAPKDSAAAVCVNDADLNTAEIADAALNDAGATAPACAACARTKCASDFSACNGECECRDAIGILFNCLGDGDTLSTCIAQIAGRAGSSKKLAPLGGCMFQSCGSECALGGGSGGDAGSDAAPRDAASGG